MPDAIDDHQCTWIDARELGIGGRGWDESLLASPYDRLPARVLEQLPEGVAVLGQQSAGLWVDFASDATAIHGRWRFHSDAFTACSYETMLSGCGLDCYGRDRHDRWRWVGACGALDGSPYTGCLNRGCLDGCFRHYRIYLPQRYRLAELAIGVPTAARLETVPTDARPPIVYYGSSIVHGSASARSGMCHAAQLGRRLDHPLINLGVAGKARMEPIIAELLAEVEAAVYIVDALPNMQAEEVSERLLPFVEIIRQHRPETPILFVADRRFGDASFIPAREIDRRQKNHAQQRALALAGQAGFKHLHLAEQPSWFGGDDEGTVDGSHPSDLGAWRMARKLYPAVRRLLVGQHAAATGLTTKVLRPAIDAALQRHDEDAAAEE